MKNPEILARTRQTLLDIPGLRKITWRYALIVAAINLVILLVDIAVYYASDLFGGLSGIGLRSALETFGLAVSFASMFVLPLLSFGHMSAALRAARSATPENTNLMDGFRRFGPLLRLTLLRLCIYLLIIPAAINIGSILYYMLPGSREALASLETMAIDPNAMMDATLTTDILMNFWPMYVLIVGIMIALMLPINYRLRLAEFAILDGERKALRAMLYSNRSMRRNCWQLFRLDLWQWEYYLLSAIATAVVYCGALVQGGQWVYWLFTLASVGLQVLVTGVFLPRVNTAYATFYLYKFQTEPAPQSPVQQF